jgi:hypothetical protein
MAQERTSDALASEAPAAKARKTIKITDVKGRRKYGNPTPDGGVLWTHPTNEDIQKAIDDGYLVDRPFSGNQQALVDEWLAAAAGDAMKFIEVATRWHAGRIAYLVKEVNKEPIGINPDLTIHDGQHRLIAAEFRGDTEIEAVIG